MGDWIKNNKFEALLLLGVIIVAVGAFLFGSGKDRLYEEAKGTYGQHRQSVMGLEGKKPYPTPASATEFELQIDDYEEVVDGLQDKILTYRPKTSAEIEEDKDGGQDDQIILQHIPPPQFIEKLNAARSEVTRAFDSRRVEYPGDKFYLGFENYTGGLPKDGATAQLGYQLGAMKALFGVMADAGASALLNVHRAQLPVEKDKVEEAPKGRRKKSSTKEPPYHRLPVEVTFRSTETVMRKIISDLASHEDYYFVVRSIRIQNEKRDQAPAKDDVKFEAPAEEAGEPFADEFGDALPPDDSGEPADPADPALPGDPVAPGDPDPAVEAAEGRRILGQVLGAEQVNVLLEIDVVLFKAKDEGKRP